MIIKKSEAREAFMTKYGREYQEERSEGGIYGII